MSLASRLEVDPVVAATTAVVSVALVAGFAVVGVAVAKAWIGSK